MLLAKDHSTPDDVHKLKSMVVKVNPSSFRNLNFQRDDNFHVARNSRRKRAFYGNDVP